MAWRIDREGVYRRIAFDPIETGEESATQGTIYYGFILWVRHKGEWNHPSRIDSKDRNSIDGSIFTTQAGRSG